MDRNDDFTLFLVAHILHAENLSHGRQKMTLSNGSPRKHDKKPFDDLMTQQSRGGLPA